MRQPDASVYRRRLRGELRRAREAADITQRDAAKAMDWSLSKLIRIETGSVNIGTNDLRALLLLYGVTDAGLVESLVATARAARVRSPWLDYRDVVSAEYLTYLGYEASAEYIRNFETSAIPGLLQTEEYARELLRALPGRRRQPKEIDSLVELRLERQELLTREDAPSLFFVMDEAAIRRAVGSPAIMRKQLNKLLDVRSTANVDVLVKPFSQGVYSLWRTPFVHFQFPDENDEDVLYIESPEGELLVRESAGSTAGELSTNGYLEVFQEEIEAPARQVDSSALIKAAIAGLAA